MCKPLANLIGLRFGRLTVLSNAGRDKHGRAVWRCACECGGSVDVKHGQLMAGRRQGCNDCAKARSSAPRGKGKDCPNYRHGGASRGAHTHEYEAWSSMIRRCTLPSQRSYPEYGGRGIEVCAKWREDYVAFLADVGPAPSTKHTLDRWPDVNGHYEPGNVRWATAKEQANNTRRNVRIEHGGRAMTVGEWADEIGLKYQTLWARLFVREWAAERALRP